MIQICTPLFIINIALSISYLSSSESTFFIKSSANPTGTNCAPSFEIFSYTPLKQSLCKTLSKTKHFQDKALNLILRYLDDNPKFSNCIQLISHKELEMQETRVTFSSASFTDIYLKVDTNEETQMAMRDFGVKKSFVKEVNKDNFIYRRWMFFHMAAVGVANDAAFEYFSCQSMH